MIEPDTILSDRAFEMTPPRRLNHGNGLSKTQLLLKNSPKVIHSHAIPNAQEPGLHTG